MLIYYAYINPRIELSYQDNRINYSLLVLDSC